MVIFLIISSINYNYSTFNYNLGIANASVTPSLTPVMTVTYPPCDGHEFEQAPGAGVGQGSLMCCSPRGRRESDVTKRLNWTIKYLPPGKSQKLTTIFSRNHLLSWKLFSFSLSFFDKLNTKTLNTSLQKNGTFKIIKIFVFLQTV